MPINLGFLNQILKTVRNLATGTPQSVDVSDAIGALATTTVLNLSGSGYFYSLFFSAVHNEARFGLVVDDVTLFDKNKPATRMSGEGVSTVSGIIRFNTSLVITVYNVGDTTRVYLLKALYSTDPA